MVKQVKPLEHKEEEKKERVEYEKDKKVKVEYEPVKRKYFFKQVKPLEYEEYKKTRVEYRPVVYKPVRSGTNWNLICYLIIGLAVGIFLLAGGWEIILLLLLILSGFRF